MFTYTDKFYMVLIYTNNVFFCMLIVSYLCYPGVNPGDYRIVFRLDREGNSAITGIQAYTESSGVYTAGKIYYYTIYRK